ncbi:hypothetical protein CEXT_320371, partial [Caerostris extrusa]
AWWTMGWISDPADPALKSDLQSRDESSQKYAWNENDKIAGQESFH